MATEGPGTGAFAGPEPNPETSPEPVRHPRSLFARIALVVAFFVVAVVIAGFVIRVPYTTIAPGDALSLPPLVSVQGAPTYANDRGDIRLLFVREAYHVNMWQYVRAWLDKDIDTAKDSAVNPGRLTPKQQNDQGLEAMADAKNSATEVALVAAGYKVPLQPGLIVLDLTPGMPAINVLNWGDVVISADGKQIVKASDLTAAIKKHKVGEQIALVVERGGKTLNLRVTIATFPDGAAKGQPGIGVELTPRFKFPVTVKVDTSGIGGPSAGLAMTLAIFDDLTPGDLTGGMRVAVTGTIDPAGNVGEIGGIAQKAVAARAAGVKLVLVPQCSPADPPTYLTACRDDLKRASERAGSKIKVVPVATFDQALAALRDAGGAPVKPVTTTTSTTTTT
jgi:PDZ domain-containing protein